MNNKIFRSCFITSLIVLALSFALAFGVLYEYFEASLKDELITEAEYLKTAVEIGGEKYLESVYGGEKRITLVDADGVVLFDSTADAVSLDNHAGREEIWKAYTYGHGYSARYSETLMEKTMYYALKLDDGNVLRVSTTQKSVARILLGLVHPIIFIAVVALIVSLVISHRLSSSIIKPINNIDIENPEKNDTYEELTPLLSKIASQNRTIEKQLHDAKQKQEEFRLITENMSEGLLVIDKHANVLTYNNSALILLGIERIDSENVLAVNRSRPFRDAVMKALSGERAETDMSYDDKTYSVIANPVYDDGKIIGAVIVIINVTESAKREQLRREFTSNVSHELKTPLTSISGFAEMMKNGGTPDEMVVDFSKSIYDEAQRLISLVGDIMKISELDENRVQSEWQDVDLLEVSNDVARRLEAQADRKGVRIFVTGSKECIRGVKRIIDEIIYILCDNAIKYNNDGGRVDISVSGSDNKVALTVKDTGIGIAKSEQDRVFERFYRVDKSHSKLVGGTGLGLSIVKHGAIFHNAQISLESDVDKGTSITVLFDREQNL